MRIFQVGGSVRDKLMGIQSKDFDYAVEAESFDAMRAEIQRRGYKIYLETPKYFTIRAHGPEGAADFSICRKDGIYKDGRHPETVSAATIEEDLARRDFTVNAIAIDIDSKSVLDPFKGQEDVESRILRAVGNPEDRFDEDKLRALRALRFILKGFTPDIKLLKAMRKLSVKDFEGVSSDRIRDEISKCLHQDTYHTVMWLSELSEFLGLLREREIWFKPTSEKR